MIRQTGTRRAAAAIILLLFLLPLHVNTAGAQTREPGGSGRLQELLHQIKTNYAGQVDEGKLWEGALKGMVEALGDPYSVYLSQGELAAFTADTTGTFGGIGVVITDAEGAIVVVAPLRGTPADRHGLAAGDQIIAVDGRDVRGMPADRAVDLMRGEPGTMVELTLLRNDGEFMVELPRERIEVNPVAGEMLPGGIGYISISSFNEHTERRLLETLRRLEGQGLEAVILDLRNNPGGFLSQALAVIRQFAPRGPILAVVERDGRRQIFESYQDRDRWPLVILINRGSASAAEIVAASLQELGTATLVGVPSFGKGSVQTVIPLQGGTAVKLTTARYITPGGNPITEAGLQPDVLIGQPPRAAQEPLGLYRVLSRGLGGRDVAELQEALASLGFYGGRLDGIFGAETEAALCAFQSAAVVPATGVTDGATVRALERALEDGGNSKDLQLEGALEVLRKGR